MRTLFASFLLLVGTLSGFAQSGDAILGTWLTEKKDSKVQIYKKGDKYYGKILWIKNNKNEDGSSPKLDSQNPDSKLRNRLIEGINILTDLEWDADEKEWNEGEIYDPRGGDTYSMFARLENENTLYLKGFIGFSLIGRSTIWTRVK